MFIAFNIILIGLALFIAYWWANQGVFSAILHLACVVVAGAIAFAFWEPLTMVVLKGGGFDDYAWGVSLILLFAVSLFILRLGLDRLAPANVQVPHWANLAFGGVVGLAAGVLTVGMFVIGAGHVQSTNSMMGFRGYGRSARDSSVTELNKMWVPFHEITGNFYSWLSVTSLASGQPLRHYNPAVHQQATLLRDTFFKGRGKLSLAPSAASIERLYYAEKNGAPYYYVRVNFGLEAQDFGEQLTLSSSQVRLIGAASGTEEPEVVMPTGFFQYSGYHRYDNISHYLSSEPGKEDATPEIEFRVPPGFQPRFIQIRGTRFPLPREAQPAPAYLVAAGARPDSAASVVLPGGQNIQSAIRIDNDIRPISVSTNRMPSGIQENERYLTSGTARFDRGRGFAPGSLRIQGIFEPSGTKLVRVNVSRGGPADIFRFADQAEDDATIALVDARGSEYSPIGYFYIHSDGIDVKLEPTRRLRTLDEIPLLPTSGSHDMELLFYVTQGVTVTGLRYGDIDVGHCDLVVPKEEEDS
ncbi:MAG: CvpA family protein [Phycisphaerales bacterium]|nr:CvpA family protein [Phycisphaerae bacterium]NNF44161.1 CvpA family protein [Phycisphaerales bacterium]NNM26515.1 CvpA family protein [Phycisphaerales bacterium]